MRLLCIAAQGTPYGHVTVAGKAPDPLTLAKLVRCKQPSLVRLIAELERKGVAHRGACGCLVSRRMESDGRIATLRARAGQSGAEARYRRDFAMANESVEPSLESHTPAEAKQDSPHAPRKRGVNGGGGNGGEGKKQREPRNAFVTKAGEIIEDRDAQGRVVPMRRVQ